MTLLNCGSVLLHLFTIRLQSIFRLAKPKRSTHPTVTSSPSPAHLTFCLLESDNTSASCKWKPYSSCPFMTGSCRLKAHPCCNVSNFLSKAEKHSITRSYPILFIPLSGYVGCFYLLAIVSHAAVNMGVQTSLRLFFLILLGVYLLIACLIFEAPPCFLFHCGCTVLQRYLLNRVFHWPYFLFWLSAHLPESQPDMAFDF